MPGEDLALFSNVLLGMDSAGPSTVQRLCNMMGSISIVQFIFEI